MVERRRGFHSSGGILGMDVHISGAVEVHNGGMVSLLAISQGVDDLDMNFTALYLVGCYEWPIGLRLRWRDLCLLIHGSLFRQPIRMQFRWAPGCGSLIVGQGRWDGFVARCHHIVGWTKFLVANAVKEPERFSAHFYSMNVVFGRIFTWGFLVVRRTKCRLTVWHTTESTKLCKDH